MIQLDVVTPEGSAFSGPVEQVVLPGVEGEFGVLESHERFLSALQHGVMEIRTGSGSVFDAVSGGFAEVTGERCVVMVDAHTPAAKIDVAAHRSALDAAEAELAGLARGDDEDRRADLEDAVLRASAHIAAGGRA